MYFSKLVNVSKKLLETILFILFFFLIDRLFLLATYIFKAISNQRLELNNKIFTTYFYFREFQKNSRIKKYCMAKKYKLPC